MSKDTLCLARTVCSSACRRRAARFAFRTSVSGNTRAKVSVARRYMESVGRSLRDMAFAASLQASEVASLLGDTDAGLAFTSKMESVFCMDMALRYSMV